MNDNRQFLASILSSGLELGILTPADLMKHVTAEVLAHHLPVVLKSKLLTAALAADAMTPILVVDTLGVDAVAEHAPAPILWECVAEVAARSLAGEGPSLDPITPGPEDLSPESDKKSGLKPNRSTRPSRVRAGATSRPKASAVVDDDDDDDSVFEVDTRVGAEQVVADYDVIDETNVFGDKAAVMDEETAHGAKRSG